MYIIAFIVCTILGLIGVIFYYRSKNKTVELICQHPELSDEKVKSITTMMTREHKKFFWTKSN